MKKFLMILVTAGLVQIGLANVPGGPCKDKNGNVVPCKNSTKEDDSKAEKDLKEGVNKTEKGVKHGAYDATHNKVTKKTDINQGNQKYKYQDDVK